MVAIDFTWLAQDFTTSLDRGAVSGGLKLLDYLRDRDICPFEQGNATLQELAAFAVGKHLPKPEAVRCSAWDAVLSDEQLDYAYLDAFIAANIYTSVRSKKAYNINVGSRSFPAGTEILLARSSARASTSSTTRHTSSRPSNSLLHPRSGTSPRPRPEDRR